jgi:hypothetical protein
MPKFLKTFESADRQIVIPSRIRELCDTSLVTINAVQRLDEFELYSRPLLSVIFKLTVFGRRIARCSGGEEVKHFRDGANKESVYGA